MRIFLDANILFSAAKSDGPVRELLGLLADAGHECCADEYVVEEARRNLTLKFPQGLSSMATLLIGMDVAPNAPDEALAASLPLAAKDRPVLAAAIRHRCAALVTGDWKHFGLHYGKSLHGVTIHSPRSIAEALLTTSAREPLAKRYSTAIGRRSRRGARRARSLSFTSKAFP